jgi:hypothetical protein
MTPAPRPPARTPLPLMVLARDRGERIATYWHEYDSGVHAVEIAIERAAGNTWARRWSVTIRLSELWLVSDALLKCIELAGGVRR